jgi:hypothetical protein
MDITKRKKIYYVPGIISLTILPFVFIYFANREIKPKTFTVLSIFLADTNLPKKYPELFTKYNGHFPPQRNYTEIILTGDNRNDETKLDSAQLRIREILSQKDTKRGVHFRFTDNSQYGTFVKTVDILYMERAKTFMPLDNRTCRRRWQKYFVTWKCFNQ